MLNLFAIILFSKWKLQNTKLDTYSTSIHSYHAKERVEYLVQLHYINANRTTVPLKVEPKLDELELKLLLKLLEKLNIIKLKII